MTESAALDRDHFARLVAQWSHFGPPLRPSPQDTAAIQAVAAGLRAGATVAVLGLTPEIIGCDWPAGTALTAVDHSPAMLAALWPPARGPQDARAVQADWLALPFADATLDLVAGDGCFVAFGYPDGYTALVREVRRVLKPGGIFAIRVFLRPDRPESLTAIAADFAAGAIGSVHALKLRLLAALHGHSGPGTRLDDVWQAWRDLPPLPPRLAGQRGWSADEITGIEGYHALTSRYYLPSLAEFRAVLAGDFSEQGCSRGGYELGSLCPTLVFARR